MHKSARRVGNVVAKSPHGFTLLELLVVLVIVGVLAAVAFPSFMSQVRKSRRAEAITEVHRVAQAEERWRATNTTYNNNLGTQPLNAGLNLFTSTGAITTYNMANGYYTISIANTSAVRYTVTATATGSMTGDTNCRTLIMDVDSGNIVYTSTNAAAQTNTAQSAANLGCWNRG